MIDVQARLAATGRCYVSPDEKIVAMVQRYDANQISKCQNHPWGVASHVLVDPEHPAYRETNELFEQSFYVSTSGLILYLWHPRAEYRNDGREKRESAIARTLGTEAIENWHDNMWFHMECVAWLLNLDDVKRGEWGRLSRSIRK